jgi:hypothetical protein
MRDLQWRWMTASSMKEVVKIDANKRQAMRRRISVDSIIYNCMESLSEQSGAERRHFVKCKLVRPEVLSKKKKKMLGSGCREISLESGCREISLEECDERRLQCSASVERLSDKICSCERLGKVFRYLGFHFVRRGSFELVLMNLNVITLVFSTHFKMLLQTSTRA